MVGEIISESRATSVGIRTPAAFETRTEKPRATVLVHVEFQESEAAEAFERDFEAYTDG
jgi:hypothetical protein